MFVGVAELRKIQKKQKMRLLALFAFAGTFLVSILSQEQSEQQTQQINREAIEAILSLVSPACRSEMEAAMESQTDVSQECRSEIQKAVHIISGYQQRQGQEFQGEEGEESEETENAAETKPVPKHAIHPGIWIAAFVVLLIGGASAYVMHVSKLLQEAFPEKPQKKLSKKKVSDLLFVSVVLFVICLFSLVL